MKYKVYICSYGGKSKRLVAAKTKKAAAVLMGVNALTFREFASETANPQQVSLALSNIGTVFEYPSTDYSNQDPKPVLTLSKLQLENMAHMTGLNKGSRIEINFIGLDPSNTEEIASMEDLVAKRYAKKMGSFSWSLDVFFELTEEGKIIAKGLV